MVKSLAEVKEIAFARFGLTPGSCHVSLDDRTEVDSEGYFSSLQDQTKLIVVGDRGEWMTGIWGATLN